MNRRQRRAHARIWRVLFVLLLGGITSFLVYQQVWLLKIGGG